MLVYVYIAQGAGPAVFRSLEGVIEAFEEPSYFIGPFTDDHAEVFDAATPRATPIADLYRRELPIR